MLEVVERVRPYLALRVAAPGVNVSRGGERQTVFRSHSHVLDVGP